MGGPYLRSRDCRSANERCCARYAGSVYAAGCGSSQRPFSAKPKRTRRIRSVFKSATRVVKPQRRTVTWRATKSSPVSRSARRSPKRALNAVVKRRRQRNRNLRASPRAHHPRPARVAIPPRRRPQRQASHQPNLRAERDAAGYFGVAGPIGPRADPPPFSVAPPYGSIIGKLSYSLLYARFSSASLAGSLSARSVNSPGSLLKL